MTAFNPVAGYGSPQIFSSGSMKTLELNQLLGLILVELRMTNMMLNEAFNLQDPLRSLREAQYSDLENNSEIAGAQTLTTPS